MSRTEELVPNGEHVINIDEEQENKEEEVWDHDAQGWNVQDFMVTEDFLKNSQDPGPTEVDPERDGEEDDPGHVVGKFCVE
jgi:hypothetical protein